MRRACYILFPTLSKTYNLNPPRLVLASGSRYRAELLRRLQIDFTIAVSSVDETPVPGESPMHTAARLARAKADAVSRAHPDAWIIGSDQVADLDGVPINKPGSRGAAEAQLARLSGQRVAFHTGVCLWANGHAHERVVTTEVVYRSLTATTIRRYLDLEPAFDCAGSAKSEGLGITLLSSMSTPDPTALVGLPLIALTELLAKAGWSLPSAIRSTHP
ncbi:MAG: septum formation protein Maf [Betaproteobacteria bacterium]|nr:septum formation protein Maf [Betaproteobacteria bacterium]